MANSESLDIVWILICAAMVLVMQPGFLCLESGMVRSKNSINVAVKNLLDLCVVGLVFWVVGYGLMFGTSQLGLFGGSDFLLSATDEPRVTTMFIFQYLSLT